MVGRVGIWCGVRGSVGAYVWRGDGDRSVDGGGSDNGRWTPTCGTGVVDTTGQRRRDLSSGGVEVVTGPVVDTADGHGAGGEGEDGKGDENLWS